MRRLSGGLDRERCDLRALGPARRSEVLDALCALDARVFGYPHVTARRRYHEQLRASADREVAILYRRSGALVGFNLVKLTALESAGRTWSVVSSAAGFVPEERGAGRTFPDAFALMLRWMLREPWRRWTFVSFIISPSAYDLLTELNPAVAPSPTRPALGIEERALLDAVCTRGGYRRASDTPDHLTIWLRWPAGGPGHLRDTPRTRFFTTRCPSRGEALGVVAPITFSAIVGGLLRHLRRRARRAQFGSRTAYSTGAITSGRSPEGRR